MKPVYDGTTSDLNISSKYINCDDVLSTLLTCGIKCTVIPHKSVICNKNDCWIEPGCSVKLNGLSHKEINHKVWKPLQTQFNLKCAHLHIHGYYIGCILDFIRPSECN